MYIRLPIIIEKADPHNLDPKFHTDEYLVSSLTSLGWELLGRLNEDSRRETEYITECVKPGTKTQAGSLLHHRDLATKNGKKLFNESVIKEIQNYGIYFGAMSEQRASFFVCRTTNNCITVIVFHRDVTVLHKATVVFCQRIMELPFVDKSETEKQVSDIYSSESYAKVGSGKISQKTFRSAVSNHKVDATVIVLSFLLLLLFGTLSQLPDEIWNENFLFFKQWSSEIWKASLGAMMGSLLSFGLKWYFMDGIAFQAFASQPTE